MNYRAQSVIVSLAVALGAGSTVAESDAESGAPYVLSDRVGTEIDRYERNYFGLFPWVEGYMSATVSALGDGRVRFAISAMAHDSISQRVVTISMKSSTALSSIINDYEGTLGSDFLRRPLDPSDQRVIAPTRAARIVDAYDLPVLTIRSVEGLTTRLRLAHVSDTSMVAWHSLMGYDTYTVRSSAALLRYSDIDRMVLERESRIGTGILIGACMGVVLGSPGGGGGELGPALALVGVVAGALVGGVIGAAGGMDVTYDIRGDRQAFLRAARQIRRWSMFPGLPPPEIRALMMESSRADPVKGDVR